MKTLHQRLQSRISKRRNFIRLEEEALSVLKESRVNLRNFSSLFGVEFDSSGINEEISELRKVLNALADDQRLDKKLKSVISEQDTMRQFYGYPELA